MQKDTVCKSLEANKTAQFWVFLLLATAISGKCGKIDNGSNWEGGAGGLDNRAKTHRAEHTNLFRQR